MIERFPVLGVGHRHRLMTRAVGSLVGRGYDDATVTAVVMRWYEHFRSFGSVGTEPAEMERELTACLASTRNNPAFNPARPQADYEAAAKYTLPQDTLDRMNAPLANLLADDPGEGRESPESGTGFAVGEGQDQGAEDQRYQDPCYLGEDTTPDPPTQLYRGNTNEPFLVGVTRATEGGDSPGNTKRRPLMDALCGTRDERWFVEGLLAMFAIDRQRESGTTAAPATRPFRFTHDQLRLVVSARFGEAVYPVWANTQIGRLKEKYIYRIGADGQHAPATRFELFREVVKGQRARGADKGTPSAYEPTGIESFFLTTPVIPP